MKKKQAILDVAAKLFSQNGFKEAPISMISKLTGAAEGTIFYHFKTKEGLFLAILEDFKNSIVEKFKEFIDESKFDSGIGMMEDIISFYLYLSGSMEDRFLLLHRHDAYELSTNNPECREYLELIVYHNIGSKYYKTREQTWKMVELFRKYIKKHCKK